MSLKNDPYYLVDKHGIPRVLFDAFLAELAKCYEGPVGEQLLQAKPRPPRPKPKIDRRISQMVSMSVRGLSWGRIATKFRIPKAEVVRLVSQRLIQEQADGDARKGERVGPHTIIAYHGRNKDGRHLWVLLCRCGAVSRCPALTSVANTERCQVCPRSV